MSTIDVLWLEDQPKDSFIKLAKDEDFNIHLIWVATANEAIEYINKYINQLDGAILDVRGHRNPNDELGDKGMYQVKDELKKYYLNRPIPVAVITGQEDLLKKEGFEDTLNTRLFRKNRDEEAVLEFIRDGAKELDDVKIKIENHLAFEIFDEKIVKTVVDESKLQVLKFFLVKQLKEPIDNILTPRIIRGFFEGLIFPLLKHYNIIPSYSNSFNDMAKKLQNRLTEVGELEQLYWRVALCSQGLNHEKPEVKMVNYIETRKDPYYIDSLFKGLLSCLTWLPVFIKKHPSMEGI